MIDVYLSDKRDKEAAKRFFKNCIKTTGVTLFQITTDKEPAFTATLQSEF